MVANPHGAPDPQNPDFSAYSQNFDRDNAAFDIVSRKPCLFVIHEAFLQPEELSPEELRELLIKQAALRIAAGLELRSLRRLARDIGCTPTAIDNATRRICESVGIRKYRTRDGTRKRQSEARQNQLLKLAFG